MLGIFKTKAIWSSVGKERILNLMDELDGRRTNLMDAEQITSESYNLLYPHNQSEMASLNNKSNKKNPAMQNITPDQSSSMSSLASLSSSSSSQAANIAPDQSSSVCSSSSLSSSSSQAAAAESASPPHAARIDPPITPSKTCKNLLEKHKSQDSPFNSHKRHNVAQNVAATSPSTSNRDVHIDVLQNIIKSEPALVIMVTASNDLKMTILQAMAWPTPPEQVQGDGQSPSAFNLIVLLILLQKNCFQS